MKVEIFVWSWMNLHPHHVLKQTAKFLGIALLVLVPLLALNVALVKRGFVHDKPGLEINLSQSTYPGDTPPE